MIGVDTGHHRLQGAPLSTASMGPRRDWRGYAEVQTKAWLGSELQWGHAVIGVDTSSAKPSPVSRSSLQWGHAVIGVDTSEAIAAGIVPGTASMGPRRDWRGYDLLRRV